jgi:preprotein translocase subunit SecE
MGKERPPSDSGWMQILHELFRYDLYKRTQGRMVRQITCLVIWVTVAIGAWRMYSLMSDPAFKYALPALLLVAGLWIGYRVVNIPSFADFLIAVEAEMNKVSWPSQSELIRASMVVIILIFGLTVVLFAYDYFWASLLVWMGVIKA